MALGVCAFPTLFGRNSSSLVSEECLQLQERGSFLITVLALVLVLVLACNHDLVQAFCLHSLSNIFPSRCPQKRLYWLVPRALDGITACVCRMAAFSMQHMQVILVPRTSRSRVQNLTECKIGTRRTWFFRKK